MVRGTSGRYTYFRLKSDLTLEVVIPRGRRVDVEKAIRDRSSWLQREYNRAERITNVLGRETVLFDGRILKIVFFESPEDKLVSDLPSGVVTIYAREKKRYRELVRRWFLRESSAYVVKKVAELAPGLGVRPTRVDVREMGKWGYCTREGRLSFSWQLAALSERLRDYVVLHELTHLIEFNHSPAFRRRLASVCPDFRNREKELDMIAPYDRLSLA